MGSVALSDFRIKFLKLLLTLVLSVFPATNLFAADSAGPVNKDKSGIAIKGYDPVAYFADNRAVKGKQEFEYIWQGARWLFSSAAHRDLFAANPEHYMPQYGGY